MGLDFLHMRLDFLHMGLDFLHMGLDFHHTAFSFHHMDLISFTWDRTRQRVVLLTRVTVLAFNAHDVVASGLGIRCVSIRGAALPDNPAGPASPARELFRGDGSTSGGIWECLRPEHPLLSS